jgi:hypothetical protein
VAEGVRSSVQAALAPRTKSGDWVAMIEMRDEVRTHVNQRHDPTDPLFLLRMVTEEWRSFRPELSHEQRALATELRSVATRWSRGEAFRRADAHRFIDTAARLLDSLDADDARLAASAARSLTAEVEDDAVEPRKDSGIAAVIEGVDGSIEAVLTDAELARVLDDWRDRTGLGSLHLSVPGVELHVEYQTAVNFALAHNGVSPIVSLTLVNTTDADVEIAVVDLTLGAGEGVDVGAPLSLGPLTVPALAERHVPAPMLRWPLSTATFAGIQESLGATLHAVLVTPDGRAEADAAVTLLAADEWWAGAIPESIAAFVAPRDPAVVEAVAGVASRLAKATSDSSINGYQAGAERAIAIARCVWDELTALGLALVATQASHGGVAQRVRRPSDVVASGTATAMEIAVFWAAVAEAAGLNPVLVVARRHAFAGVMVTDSQLPLVAIDDEATLSNFVESTILWPVETSVALSHRDATLERAVQQGREWLRENRRELDYMVDVRRAHRRVRPLPVVRLVDGRVIVEVERQAERALRSTPSDSTRYEGKGPGYPPRVAAWRNSLLDLTFRNPLLNMKTQRSGVDLAIPAGYLGAFEDMLAKGVAFTVSTSDDVGALAVANGAQTAWDMPRDQLANILEGEHLVYSHLPNAQYQGRVVTLMRKARTVLEETGANNLYLALGSLVWDDAGREARAPLFLLPATIKGRRGQLFKVQAEEGAVAVANQCLLEKLRVSKQLTVPALEHPLADDAGIDVDDALSQLRFALLDAGLPYKVEETAHLAVFQFSTLQLWQDVTENWESFLGNSVVRHLVQSPTDSFDDPVGEPVMDAQAEVTEVLPVNADGSQIEAVRWATAGRSFVLEGPPGTGKSQTITNVIANSLAKGRRVLFVAEKQAALDVVKRRLESVGLGAYCLDLHGRNQSPNEVRAQLREALYAHRASHKDAVDALYAQQSSLVSNLDRYPQHLHEPGAAGFSAWQARQVMLTLAPLVGDADVPEVSAAIVSDGALLETATQWSRALGEGVQDLGTAVGAHPWSLAGAPVTAGTDRSRIVAAVTGLASALEALGTGAERAFIAHARTHAEFDVATAFAAHAVAGRTGSLDEAAAAVDAGWQQRAFSLREDVNGLAGVHVRLLATAQPQIVHATALDEWLARSTEADRKLFKSKRRRVLAAEMAPVLRPDVAPDLGGLTTLLNEAAMARHRVMELKDKARGTLGVRLPEDWNPLAADGPSGFWDAAEALYASAGVASMSEPAKAAAARLTQADAGPFATQSQGDAFGFGGGLLDAPVSPAAHDGDSSRPQRESKARALRDAWLALLSVLDSRPSDVARWARDRTVLDALAQDLPVWTADSSGLALVRLTRWDVVQHHARILEDAGAGEFVAAVRNGTIGGEYVESAFRFATARAALSERLIAGGFVGFDGRQRERLVQRYVEGGRAVRDALVEEVPARIVTRRTFTTDRLMGRVGELDRELGRKRGGMSIRRLLTEYGSVIGEITPCLLMSPHSVARFLPPGAVDIDIVVFDEASQIRVAEAVGAMGRGRSVVVVGDSRQMPPTEFGGSDMFASADEDDEDADSLAPVDQESILTEAVESRLPRLWLSWHYRSRDESLIAFSNRYYYEGRLSSFPAPPDARDDVGLSWRRIDGTFERGKKRVNRDEARAIVAEIRAILSDKPEASIGVVTFNVEQRELILDMLEAERDPRVDAAMARPEDPIFVKNLENVQGDERDIILFSLAFSPDPDTGKLPLNFGPLNRSGGERRLNVAITRARERIVVFSSFSPEHIELDRTSSLGLEHLRDYLSVAAFGVDGAMGMRTANTRDLHRDQIAARLEDAGLEVRRQVGLSDFTVDLAVRADGKPWVAVLLDTPTWASRVTVGDREALPHAVLHDAMGWDAVVRVWLPAWVYEADQVVEDIVAAAQGAGARPVAVGSEADEVAVLEAPGDEDVLGQAGDEGDRVVGEADGEDGDADDDREGADGDGDEGGDPEAIVRPASALPLWSAAGVERVSLASLADLDRLQGARARERVAQEVADVVATEAPLSADRLGKLVTRRLGLSRASGFRVRQVLSLVPAEQVHTTVLGTFVYPAGMAPQQYRGFRAAPEGTRRELEDIAPHEILNAMKFVAVAGHGALVEEVLKETAALFGYARLTAPVRTTLASVLDIAKSANLVDEVDGRIYAQAAVADAVRTWQENAVTVRQAEPVRLVDLEVEVLPAEAGAGAGPGSRAAGAGGSGIGVSGADAEPGLELKPGDLVVFTGISEARKRELTELAEARGLVVWPNVKKGVAAVIAKDPGSGSVKARKAREYGIPVVGEGVLS